MYKFKNKLIVSILSGVIILTPIAYLQSANTNIIYAAESKALRDAKAKINHLTTSLKTNYLGIKNQGTWQLYISQARELIKKIPNSEKKQRDTLTAEINKDEALVNALARINQVEKSTTSKDKGGYGNYLGIKNAETWRSYLNLAKTDLEKVDKNIFKKQYDELISRMNKVATIVKNIEDEFQIEYNKVVKMFQDAKDSKDIDKAKVALVEAEKLGTCNRSDVLKLNIKRFINNKDAVNFRKYENYRFGFSVEYPEEFTIDFESDNGDGCQIIGDFDILVYGSNNIFEDDGYSYYAFIEEYLTGDIISKKITKDYIEILSLEDGVLLYSKVIVGKNTINAIELEYPESKAKEYDDLIKYIVNSFKTPNVNSDEYY